MELIKKYWGILLLFMGFLLITLNLDFGLIFMLIGGLKIILSIELFRKKKFYGILILIISFLIILFGLFMFMEAQSSIYYDGPYSDNIYHRQKEKQLIGIFVSIIGLLFFIFGLIMILSKSKKQLITEIENKLLKESIQNKQNDDVYNQKIIDNSNISKESSNINQNSKISENEINNKLEKLYEMKMKGLISENEYEEVKKDLLKKFIS